MCYTIVEGIHYVTIIVTITITVLLIIVNILHGKPLPIYGDGLQVRDWLYVEDHCRAIEKCIGQGKAGEVYNIGGDNERPNIEIVKKLCGLIDSKLASDDALASRFLESQVAKGRSSVDLIEYVTDRPGHDRRYAIDFRKAAQDLDYAPRESFDSGFEKTINWYLKQERWWRSVMDGSYKDWLETNYVER